MNLDLWHGLTEAQRTLFNEASHTAQQTVRQLTESVDSLAKAKELLEPKGMIVVEADVDAFRRVAKEKIWPAYKQQYAGLWDQIVEFKA